MNNGVSTCCINTSARLALNKRDNSVLTPPTRSPGDHLNERLSFLSDPLFQSRIGHLWKLITLKELDLSKNKLTVLSAQIGELKKLEEFVFAR
jgi:Leucine-rich repeat (LRR) protein